VITQVKAHLRFENEYVQVFEDDVVFADGAPGQYLRIGPPPERGPGAVIIPLVEDTIGLVETFRYPIGALQWALPRGFGHPGDDSALHTAARELTEEIGPHDADLELLGWVTPDSGMLNTRVAVVLARMPVQVQSPIDRQEVSAVRWASPRDLRAQIREGRIEDGFTLAALSLGVAHGVIPAG
jgi:ADP-ribose pyrophosphatase